MSGKKQLSLLAFLALLLPASAWAHGFRGGFGFRGGHIGGFRGGFGGFRGGFVGGHFRGGFGGFAGFRHGFYRPFYRPFYYPPLYSYPSVGFYGSFGYGYWPSYYYDYAPQSYGYAVTSSPVVVEREVVRYRDREDYRPPVSSVTVERYWLIALRDKSIRAVTDYWLEGNTLHYVTRDGTKSSSDLSEVDISFTKELNRERGLEFRLPSSSGNGNGSGSYQPRRLDSYGRPY